MDKDSDRVELRGGGWSGAIGATRHWEEFGKTCQLETGKVDFLLLRFPWGFVFSHAPAMLVIQGMLLSDFFSPSDVYFTDGTKTLLTGPFILVRGILSEVQDPPPRLKQLVLAKVLRAPEQLSQAELFSKVLESLD
jgi:hypothetical protein